MIDLIIGLAIGIPIGMVLQHGKILALDQIIEEMQKDYEKLKEKYDNIKEKE